MCQARTNMNVTEQDLEALVDPGSWQEVAATRPFSCMACRPHDAALEPKGETHHHSSSFSLPLNSLAEGRGQTVVALTPLASLSQVTAGALPRACTNLLMSLEFVVYMELWKGLQ